MMKSKERKAARTGFSIVEVVVAIVVIAVAVVGTSGFRYHSTLDWRRAERHTIAARVALLLSESWRGDRGRETYDPVSHLSSNLDIEAGEGPDAPTGYTALGSYTVTVNAMTCYATMAWQDTDDLRTLNVQVVWSQRGEGDGGINDADKSFALTTYAAQ
jgi:prepilin-type N-terminal cleavage/methylation domain-containing protein